MNRFGWISVVEGLGRIRWSQSSQHQLNGTELDHGFSRLGGSFIIFACAAGATVPTIGSFDDPSLVNRNEAFRSRRRRLHFDGPLRAICFQPCVQRMVAILVVTEDHFQTRQVFDCDARQQFRGGSFGAAVPSSRFAAVTTTTISKPSVSTRR